MTHREMALAYLDFFCAGKVDEIAAFLAADFSLQGTLFTFDSKTAYLRALKADPPEACRFEIVSITENPHAVVIVYDYLKNQQPLRIAQLFRFKNGLIAEILLVFDGRGFDFE